jgi:hypothetical protein
MEESVKGSVVFNDVSIVLKYENGTKEKWVTKRTYTLVVGSVYMTYKGQTFFKQ